MNKKVAIAIVLLLLAGGYFFMSTRKTSTPGSPANTSTSSSPKSLKDLLGLGSSQKCTFSTNSGESSTNGTVYVASGKMRGDFVSVVSGKTTNSHMISDATTSYTWMEGEKTGYKMTFNPSEVSQASGAPQPASGGPDVSTPYDYNCSGWVADSSVFTPPSDIKFMSLGDLLPSSKPAASGAASGLSSQCSYCDSLTGDSKTQCLSALNCK